MQPFKPQTAGEHPPDREHGHETRDVNPVGVYAFLIFLTVGGVILFVLLGGVYKFANRYAEEQDRKVQERNPWMKQQADEERQELEKMTEAYRAVGVKPSSKDVTQRESQMRIARIRQPRLQNDEAWDMEMLRQVEDVRLNNYILLDKSSGKVSIPIEQAMKLFLQRQPPAAAGAAQNTAINDEIGGNAEITPLPASGTGTTRPSIESSHAKASGGKD
jgi:hypothetical protein